MKALQGKFDIWQRPQELLSGPLKGATTRNFEDTKLKMAQLVIMFTYYFLYIKFTFLYFKIVYANLNYRLF